nr:unnamed protein product [Digitaria exilis]
MTMQCTSINHRIPAGNILEGHLSLPPSLPLEGHLSTVHRPPNPHDSQPPARGTSTIANVASCGPGHDVPLGHFVERPPRVPAGTVDRGQRVPESRQRQAEVHQEPGDRVVCPSDRTRVRVPRDEAREGSGGVASEGEAGEEGVERVRAAGAEVDEGAEGVSGGKDRKVRDEGGIRGEAGHEKERGSSERGCRAGSGVRG